MKALTYEQLLAILPNRPLNLGQVIGAGILPGPRSCQHPKRYPLGRRQSQALAIAAHGTIGAFDLASRLGISLQRACVLLNRLKSQGLLTRIGEQGSYRYSKAKA